MPRPVLLLWGFLASSVDLDFYARSSSYGQGIMDAYSRVVRVPNVPPNQECPNCP